MASAVYEDPNEDHGHERHAHARHARHVQSGQSIGRSSERRLDRQGQVRRGHHRVGRRARRTRCPPPSRSPTTGRRRSRSTPTRSPRTASTGIRSRNARETTRGVAYDDRTWILTVTVADDLTTFKRHITANTTCDGVRSDAVQFTNTYQAKPVSVQFRARKTLADPDHTGVRLQAGQYEFTCVEDKTGGQVGTAKTNDQRGDVLFDAISYTRRERTTTPSGKTPATGAASCMMPRNIT